MLKIGTEIDGKYKVLNEIGHGGMSRGQLRKCVSAAAVIMKCCNKV